MVISSYKNSAYAWLFILVLISCRLCIAQQNKIDSLQRIIGSKTNDTLRSSAYLSLASLLIEHDTMKAFGFLENAIELAENDPKSEFYFKAYDKAGRICYAIQNDRRASAFWNAGLVKAKTSNQKKWQSRYYSRIAGMLHHNDLSKQSLVYYDSALLLIPETEFESKAKLLSSKGRAHYDNGDYKQAMNFYIQSQRIFEKNKLINSDYGHLLHYIGSVFKRQKFYDKALEYYLQEHEVAKKIDNKNLEAEALYLSAAMYGLQGDLVKEYDYLQLSLELYSSLNDKRLVGLIYSNMSSNYADRGLLKEALASQEKAVQIYTEVGERESLAGAYELLGNLHHKSGDQKKAMSYLKKAIDLVQLVETKQLLHMTDIKETMAHVYAADENYRSAYETILEYMSLHDSLNNQSNAEYLHELETQYETEKKEKEIALLNADKKLQKDELEKKESQRNMMVVVAFLGVVIAVFAVFAFLYMRKSRRLLRTQMDEIQYKNSIISEKNKDITDSIQYAKRLQDAVLQEAESLSKYFRDSFVLFRPRDIVSGDFYWFEQLGDKVVLAVGDCTGHGVPGAFMSILGHNLLNQIVIEQGVVAPDEILKLLDKQVINTLNKRGAKETYSDGMDIAICVLDKNKKELDFAGANRPLLLCDRNKIREIKPDKIAIGGAYNDREKIFAKHTYSFEEGDVLYLFSDGYADQFGGAQGKKFKYRQLIEKLKSLSSEPLKDQHRVLSEIFDSWRGKLEQVDDVCIIGVRT